MRYCELVEARRPWKHFNGREHTAHISPLSADVGLTHLSTVNARYGLTHTGRARVFHGYFVEVSGLTGETWLGEDRYSLRRALRDAASQLEADGWSLLAIGLTRLWHETGLTANSGYGYHPGCAGAVHMLERLPDEGNQD